MNQLNILSFDETDRGIRSCLHHLTFGKQKFSCNYKIQLSFQLRQQVKADIILSSFSPLLARGAIESLNSMKLNALLFMPILSLASPSPPKSSFRFRFSDRLRKVQTPQIPIHQKICSR